MEQAVSERCLELAAGGEREPLEPEDLVPRQALVNRLHVLELPGRCLLWFGLVLQSARDQR